MENITEQIKQYLAEIETFLTSVLLEETNIEIVSSEEIEKEAVTEDREKNDIFLFIRDNEHESDVIVVLEKVWYSLLSSIMLGVDEKTNNEITRDLLKKFSNELSAALIPEMEANDLTIDIDAAEVQVLTAFQVEKLLGHTEYFWTKFEVEGLADDKVRAELFIGNPEAQIQPGEPEDEEELFAGNKSEKEFSGMEPEDMEDEGSYEDVVSGRYIQFEDFDSPETNGNGDTRSMDLLKDVEMDVSVELGRIELPLGKVLQLAKGSVIELEKLAGEPVDILVNGHCIAHGEVVVIDEHFGVRISNLITTKQRLAGLK